MAGSGSLATMLDHAPGPVRMALRVDDTNPGHTWVSVFVGRTPGARGYAGQLCLRTDEFCELMVSAAELHPGDWLEADLGPADDPPPDRPHVPVVD